MTMIEFEAWISDNYLELRKLSRCLVGNQNGDDVLHDMIESMCAGRHSLPPGLSVGIFAKELIHDNLNLIKSAEKLHQAMDQFGISLEVLGEDTFLDISQGGKGEPPSEVGRLIKNRIKRGADPAVREVEKKASHLFYGQTGDTRWRYQTMRDGRLFDERAVRSLAESIHRTSQRVRHMGWPGFSHTEFGTENA
jgi:hypothetical protein